MSARLRTRAEDSCGALRLIAKVAVVPTCVTDVLSIPGGPEALSTAIKGAMQAWIKSFAEIARESGLSPALARSRGEEAIARLEGSLVIARVLGDNTVFERVLRMLPELLTVA